SIEDEHGASPAMDDWEPVKHQEPCGDRHENVAPVVDRRWRGNPEQEIARDATDVSCSERQHEHAEDFELLADAERSSTQGEDERAREVKGYQQRMHRELHELKRANVTCPCTMTSAVFRFRFIENGR